MELLKKISRTSFFPFFVLCWFSIYHAPVMASDQFVNNNNGTVTDTVNGLMWVSKDNGIPISWPDAVAYCKNLQTAGFTDWRMPTLAELKSLYNPSEKNKNGYHTIKLITTNAQSCWAIETRGYSAGRFNFTYGKEYWLRQSYSGRTCVLPVRTDQ